MTTTVKTSTVTVSLDVLDKYEALVKESLDGESVYIRAKETMEKMFKDSEINSTDKANVISSIVGSMVNGITNASMSTALEWAKYEKELALKKLELDQQLLLLEKDGDLKDAQIEQAKIQNRLAQIESKRMFGTGVFDGNDALVSLTEEGKVWNDMQLVSQQTDNAAVQKEVLESQVVQSQVAIHKIVADTYTNFGSFTYSLNAEGNGIDSVTDNTPSSYITLSEVQRNIAIEQGKGYTYNAWANALSGSASILGTALASGDFDFSSGSSGEQLLYTVLNCATNLKNTNSTSSEAIPTANLGA